MPNSITQKELDTLRFVRAGAIRLVGRQCEPHIKDVEPCVIYAHVVERRVMKFGSARSLADRMVGNCRTINQILEFQDGRSTSKNLKITDATTYDKFKQQAPAVIRSGREIEVWAASRSSREACKDLNPDPNKRFQGKCSDCIALERELNLRYQTTVYGWAKRSS